MKLKGAAEKWASGVLGVVCLVLLANLLMRNGVHAGTVKPTPIPGKSKVTRRVLTQPAAAKDDLAGYDPQVKLDLLSELQSRPLPAIERNPFEFPKPKPVPPAIGPQPPRPPAATAAPAALAIKLIGYTEKASGVKEGVVTEQDEIYVVHEGETFAKRYKVNKLTATMMEIYDEVTRQTVELPMAQ